MPAPVPASANDGRAAGAAGQMALWNPFDDSAPFCQLNEDHLFGAEFDRIRRGSQNSQFETEHLKTEHVVQV